MKEGQQQTRPAFLLSEVATLISQVEEMAQLDKIEGMVERRRWEIERAHRMHELVERHARFRQLHPDELKPYERVLNSFRVIENSYTWTCPVTGQETEWIFPQHLSYYPLQEDCLILKISNVTGTITVTLSESHQTCPTLKDDRLLDFFRLMYNLYYIELDTCVYDEHSRFLIHEAPRDLLLTRR